MALTGRTRWTALSSTPMRTFLRTESGSALVLLGAAVVALLWVNIDQASYDDLWQTDVTVRLGHWAISLDLRGWVNDGLMAFFFFVVGLGSRREADLGELRALWRVALPRLAGLCGMVVPIAVYLAFNGGRSTAGGWGGAMSTDPAFALGALVLVGPKFSARLGAFMLTVVVVDDIVALLVIAFAYSEGVDGAALAVAAALLVVVLVVRAFHVQRGLPYAVLGIAMWVAMVNSGIDPLVVGLVMGLLAYAYPAARVDLERATEQFRLFREQPTPELARRASAGVEAAISPNERLSQLWHPWSGYVIVPVFALPNAGIPLSAHFLAGAFTSPVTLGILVGYVVGKPVGIAATSMLVTAVTRGRLRPPVGWGSVTGAGASAGVGFTVSLLIASLAFDSEHLAEAKAGVLAAAVAAALLSATVFRVIDALPPKSRTLALLGRSATVVDLADPVDTERDHIRGSMESLVPLVEYGDLECPYCGQAEPVVRELLRDFTDLTYVWRHLPLDDVHPHARMAAEATEAADAQGAFWPMHDLLFEHQNALRFADLVGYAEELGLDTERFAEDVRRRAFAGRVASDVDSADLSGVSGTPTFFINGRRPRGAFDLETLSAAVKVAGARATLTG